MNNDISTKELPNILSEFALRAMLYEVSCYPAPGLVSPISTGSHKDMNHFTFIDSSLAISRFFHEVVEVSLKENDEKELFQELRKIGIKAEKVMFEATKGVNTQKGIIFLMLVSLGAVTLTIKRGKTFDEIEKYIRCMTKDILEEDFKELDKKEKLTYGEKLYLEYGLKGIRGEVAKGLPVALKIGLQIYEESADLSANQRIANTLIHIMTCCEDTTLLHRNPIKTLYYVQNTAKEAVSLGAMRTEEGRRFINDMDRDFVSKGISPGGSADLLAMTIFFHNVRSIVKE